MIKLKSIFSATVKEIDHPILRYLDANPSAQVIVDIDYPYEILGRLPAKISVSVSNEGRPMNFKPVLWDDDLNFGLVNRGRRAVTSEKEKLRFALMLRTRFRRAERQFGEGFFNSVLVKLINGEPLSELLEFSEIAEVMKDITVGEPYMKGGSFDDCQEEIQQAFHRSALELTESLNYAQNEAEIIFAGALAWYLDDRFGVTDRRRLGLT